MRVIYSLADRTKVADWKRPPRSGEGSFESNFINNDHIVAHYIIEWDVDTPRLVLKPDAEVERIVMSEAINLARRKQTDAIKSSFNYSVNKEPVQVGDMLFDGSWASIDKLDKAIRFSEIVGITERAFYEIDETPHVVPIDSEDPIVVTAKKILLAVGLAYDEKDTKKRQKIKQINVATSVEEIEAITW